jgi:transmembrane sensor
LPSVRANVCASSGAGRLEVASVDEDRLTAWRSGSLEFDSIRLDEAITDVNRFARKPLAIGDNKLRDIRISGRFLVGDTDGLLFSLRERFGIQAEEGADRVVLKAPAS